MEAQEEFMGSNDITQFVKGKRTKRQRSSSPYKGTAMTSSSSSGCVGLGGRGGGEKGTVVEEYGSITSPTSSSEVYESTEEEEDMANCLILLAQGDGPRPIENNSTRIENFISTRKFSDLATTTTTTNKAGFYVYECKTCNRSFPSFQALGGHRASHKKPKATAEDKKPIRMASSMDDHDDCKLNKSSPDDRLPFSIQTATLTTNTTNDKNNKGFQANNKAKIHECTICGSQFTSGQALGGHMRRHRPNTDNQAAFSSVDTSCTSVESNINGKIKSRSILSLDLNLPAPEDDHLHRESQFQFTPTAQALVFSAPAMVDCHY